MKPTLTSTMKHTLHIILTTLLLAPLAALHAADDAELKSLERSPISNRWGKVKPTKIQVDPDPQHCPSFTFMPLTYKKPSNPLILGKIL